MNNKEVIVRRLLNQQIAKTKIKKPEAVVAWMGAMQAQEYAMAKWAIALRLPGRQGMPVFGDGEIEKVFNQGKILRTHLLRPTWHFVAPADIRWILALTAPRIHGVSAYMYRQLEMDAKLIARSNDVIARALEGGKHLTRSSLRLILEKKKVLADGLRLSYLMMCAELAGIICSGPRLGKQFSYALLEERVPPVKALDRDESLAELSKRYFTGRGPASLQDFSVWSGLTVKDARDGLALAGNLFEKTAIDGRDYFFAPARLPASSDYQSTFLLPDYDEYGMSYKNRDVFINPAGIAGEKRGGNPVFNHMIVSDGILGGTWQRTIKNGKILVNAVPFSGLTKIQLKAIDIAVKRYQSFSND